MLSRPLRILIRGIAALVTIMLLFAGFFAIFGYHGARSFDSLPAELPPAAEVVQNARKLAGTPYDIAKGGLHDFGSRIGCIVCADVPNLAYGLSGYSLRRMLESDFLIHASAYDTSDGNRPGNRFFHRRARNLYAYFCANNRVTNSPDSAEIGDLVFYARRPGGPILHVALITEVVPDRYRIFESAPFPFLAGERSGQSPLRHGWVLRGFGRMRLDSSSAG